MAECRGCGTEFTPSRWTNTLCSDACRSRARSAASRRWRDKHPDRYQEWLERYSKTPERLEQWRRFTREKHHQRRDQGVLVLNPKSPVDAAGYLALMDEQAGLCAICGNPEHRHDPSGRVKRLAVDHNHATGAARGLLCQDCNTAIGLLSDDPHRASRAVAYLQKWHLSEQSKREAIDQMARVMG